MHSKSKISPSIPQKKGVDAHLRRVLPPSREIERVTKILLDKKNLSEFIETQFSNTTDTLIEMMEKIRVAIQFNLGLSAVERDRHETNHPLWIKKGKPYFPLTDEGDIQGDSILYDSTLQSSVNNKITNVMVIQDESKEKGFSILYQTKFRRFVMHVDENGSVYSSLTLKWNNIYADLAPEKQDESQPLRSFSPWQRHSEANFFNGRTTNKILSYLSTTYPQVFSFDEASYYKDGSSETINMTADNFSDCKTNASNIYLTLDDSLINSPPNFNKDSKKPILVVIRRQSILLGNIFQLAPAIYEDHKLHLVLQGHRSNSEILTIMSCDFENEILEHWKLKKKIILESSPSQSQAVWRNLHLLKYHQSHELINKTSAAPMVRGSDVVMREYWSGSLNIPTVYTEMVTIADIFNIENNSTLSPQARLEKFYYSDAGTSSFRRLIFSENELKQVKNIAVQIVLPHETSHAKFFWGEEGEHIERTTKMIGDVLFEMIPQEYRSKLRFAINMCCPAVAFERIGAGFGLRKKTQYIESITRALKEKYPNLMIEIKSLMLSNDDDFTKVIPPNQIRTAIDTSSERHNISAANSALAEMLCNIGASRLVWQAKPRNKEVYDLPKTLQISRNANVTNNFNFSYSGMIATLKDNDLLQLGYTNTEQPHQSVEGVLRRLEMLYQQKAPEDFEVMLGRVLLGSEWLLLSRYATDEEILLTTLLKSFLLREFSCGAGACGIDIMQVQLLYNLRHLTNDDLRNQMMTAILEMRSAHEMVAYIYQNYLTTQIRNDKDERSTLNPFILKLKTAIDLASDGACDVYTEREKSLLKLQISKPQARPSMEAINAVKIRMQKLLRYGLFATSSIVASKYIHMIKPTPR